MVNKRSFIDTLYIDRDDGSVIYRKLADLIEAAIHTGAVQHGDTLPTQRYLAQQLQINLSTVTQAFRLLREKGLIQTRTGSGSVVATPREDTEANYPSAPLEGDALDMTVNRPATPAYLNALESVLQELPRDDRYSSLQDYQLPSGPLWAREAIVHWLATSGTFEQVSAENIIITQGAQHALACTLRALTKPGDIVLADAITYQGIIELCQTLRVSLHGVIMNKEGLSPDALEVACKRYKPKALFMIPTMHNPTAITLSDVRRQQICAIAMRHNVAIIEDDVYRTLHDEHLMPMYSSAPANTYYIGGFSKTVAPGLRIGFILTPAGMAAKVAAAQRIDAWCPNPLSMLIMTRLLESGDIDVILKHNKEELRHRQALVMRHLSGFDITTYPTSTHAWLRLPHPWTTSRFITTLRTQGISVLGSDMFATDSTQAPHAVRLNVGAIRTHDDLNKALSTIANTLSSPDSYQPGAF